MSKAAPYIFGLFFLLSLPWGFDGVTVVTPGWHMRYGSIIDWLRYSLYLQMTVVMAVVLLTVTIVYLISLKRGKNFPAHFVAIHAVLTAPAIIVISFPRLSGLTQDSTLSGTHLGLEFLTFGIFILTQFVVFFRIFWK